MNMEDINFTWLMPVGPSAVPDQVEKAVCSILTQMRDQDELILVRDNDPQGYRCGYGFVPGFGPMIKPEQVGARWPLNIDLNKQVVTIDAGLDCRDCGKALNAGLIRARNPYIIRQDADDWDLPNRRECHVQQIIDDPDAAAWGAGMDKAMWIGYTTPAMAKTPLIPRILSSGMNDILEAGDVPCWHPATCFSLPHLLAVGGYPEGMKNCEDYALWCRFALKFFKVVATDEIVAVHRYRQERRPESDIAAIKELKALAYDRFKNGQEPDPTAPRVKPFNWTHRPAEIYNPFDKVQSINGVEVIPKEELDAMSAKLEVIKLSTVSEQPVQEHGRRGKKNRKPVSPAIPASPACSAPGSDGSIPGQPCVDAPLPQGEKE